MNRNDVALEQCKKDGREWEELNEVLANAYLHSADLVIQEVERAAEVNPETGESIYTCSKCKDKAYIDGKPCQECNPVGLPAEEVHPPKSENQGNGESDTEEEAELHRATRELLPTEYRCSKCSSPGKTVIHRESSKDGQKHLEFKM